MRCGAEPTPESVHANKLDKGIAFFFRPSIELATAHGLHQNFLVEHGAEMQKVPEGRAMVVWNKSRTQTMPKLTFKETIMAAKKKAKAKKKVAKKKAAKKK